MGFRRFVDIRWCALLIGAVMFAWSLIPLLDLQDRSLFAQILGQTQYETVWVSVNMTLGGFLVVASLVKWRSMLLWCEALGAFAWLAGFAPFIHGSAVTPVTLVMPLFGLVSLMLAAREVMIGAKFRRQFEHPCAGVSDFVDPGVPHAGRR